MDETEVLTIKVKLTEIKAQAQYQEILEKERTKRLELERDPKATTMSDQDKAHVEEEIERAHKRACDVESRMADQMEKYTEETKRLRLKLRASETDPDAQDLAKAGSTEDKN